MKKGGKTALSLMIAFAMISTILFVMPAGAEDQEHERVVGVQNPDDVKLYSVAWDEFSYRYAIAVGYNASSNKGVVYKYDPGGPGPAKWILVYESTATQVIYYDVVYDLYSGDGSFYFVGYDQGGGTSYAYRLNSDLSVVPLNSGGSIPGDGLYGACFDPSAGEEGTLIAVGVEGESGLIAYYDVYGGVWTSTQTSSYDVLMSATWNPNSGYIYVVGYNSGTAVAYRYDYNNVESITVPSSAKEFYNIDWQPMGGGSPQTGGDGLYGDTENGYGIVVGKDMNGHGFVWGLFENNDTTPPSFTEDVKGLDPKCPELYDVDWKDDGSMALIVGDKGTIYAYYASNPGVVVNWSSPSFIQPIEGIAVKSPHSPGYGLGVGSSSSSKISYQVSDSSTSIILDTAYPHITRVEFRDQSNVNRVNQQVDVGNTYYFLIDSYYNVSGSDEWSNTYIRIRAWYDGGSEIMSFDSAPPGGNIRFEVYYDGSSWNLVEPSSDEVVLGTAGTEHTYNDASGNVHHVVSINITLGYQVRFAPGSGWTAANDNHVPDSNTFNDADSWNFNVTVSDRNHPSAKDSWYDEFGTYAYTEVGAEDNPAGAGPPGSLITMDRPSRVFVRSNRDYYVTVDVTDLTSAAGNTIDRSNIRVQNSHTDNTTAPTDIATWTAFPSGSGVLWVWGQSSGPTYMNPLDNGVYSAGNEYGYESSPVYTPVSWRVDVPSGTAEDHFTATITFEISYP